MHQKLLALYGLKFNPFSPELPVEAIYVLPKIENFCWRIEHAQIREEDSPWCMAIRAAARVLCCACWPSA